MGQRGADERGATFVLTAICMILLLWGGAMGVDIGFASMQPGRPKRMADTAALDMARYINLADSQKSNYATHIPNGKLANVDIGQRCRNVTFIAHAAVLEQNGTDMDDPFERVQVDTPVSPAVPSRATQSR